MNIFVKIMVTDSLYLLGAVIFFVIKLKLINAIFDILK